MADSLLNRMGKSIFGSGNKSKENNSMRLSREWNNPEAKLTRWERTRGAFYHSIESQTVDRLGILGTAIQDKREGKKNVLANIGMSTIMGEIANSAGIAGQLGLHIADAHAIHNTLQLNEHRRKEKSEDSTEHIQDNLDEVNEEVSLLKQTIEEAAERNTQVFTEIDKQLKGMREQSVRTNKLIQERFQVMLNRDINKVQDSLSLMIDKKEKKVNNLLNRMNIMDTKLDKLIKMGMNNDNGDNEMNEDGMIQPKKKSALGDFIKKRMIVGYQAKKLKQAMEKKEEQSLLSRGIGLVLSPIKKIAGIAAAIGIGGYVGSKILKGGPAAASPTEIGNSPLGNPKETPKTDTPNIETPKESTSKEAAKDPSKPDIRAEQEADADAILKSSKFRKHKENRPIERQNVPVETPNELLPNSSKEYRNRFGEIDPDFYDTPNTGSKRTLERQSKELANENKPNIERYKNYNVVAESDSKMEVKGEFIISSTKSITLKAPKIILETNELKNMIDKDKDYSKSDDKGPSKEEKKQERGVSSSRSGMSNEQGGIRTPIDNIEERYQYGESEGMGGTGYGGRRRAAGKDGYRPAGGGSGGSREREPEESIDASGVGQLYNPSGNSGIIDRSEFTDQLNDPETLRMFAGRMHSEVGSQGAEAQQAWAESVFNRAAARGLTLKEAVTNNKKHGQYYPTDNSGTSDDKKYHDMIRRVFKEGTDITKGATDNSSDDVGHGYGKAKRQPDGTYKAEGETARFGGERFGRHKHDKDWQPKRGAPLLDNKATASNLSAARTYLEKQLESAPDDKKELINKQLESVKGFQEKLRVQTEEKKQLKDQDLKNAISGNPAFAVSLAEKMEGLHEVKDKELIQKYLKDGGLGLNPAQTAWCAAFVNSSLEQAGVKGTAKGENPLLASNFSDWGKAVPSAEELRSGDVLVESKGRSKGQQGAHVGFATGQTRQTRDGRMEVEMLSGNQSDSVTKKWLPANRVLMRRNDNPEYEKKVAEFEKGGKKAFINGKESADFLKWKEQQNAPNTPVQTPNASSTPSSPSTNQASPVETPPAQRTAETAAQLAPPPVVLPQSSIDPNRLPGQNGIAPLPSERTRPLTEVSRGGTEEDTTMRSPNHSPEEQDETPTGRPVGGNRANRMIDV